MPAIFAVTQDLFIVYSSNVFAILGLRALYFLLVRVIHRFHYQGRTLRRARVRRRKMLVAHVYKVPIGVSLGVIALVLTARSHPQDQDAQISASLSHRSQGRTFISESS